VKDVQTAMLIIHGEEDSQIPVAQAIMLYRGLRRLSKCPERHKLCIYPREGHAFREKQHFEDALKRLLDHIKTNLLEK